MRKGRRIITLKANGFWLRLATLPLHELSRNAWSEKGLPHHKSHSSVRTSKRSWFLHSCLYSSLRFEVDEISSNWNAPPCIANILWATVLNRLVVSHPAPSPSAAKFLAQRRHYLEDPFQSGQNNELSSFGKWLLKAWHCLLEIIWETRTGFCLPWSKVSVVFICI